MLILSIIFILLSNAVNLRRDKSILYTRVAILILISGTLLALQSLYFSNLSCGIGLFGGLFHATSITHFFQLIILLISSIVLLLTGSYPRKIWIAEYSSIGRWLSYKFLYYRSYILNKQGEQYKNLEYPLLLVFIVTGATFLVSTADLVSIFLSIELQSYELYLLSTLYRNSELATSGGLTYFLLGGLSCFILLGTSLLYGIYIITSLNGIGLFGGLFHGIITYFFLLFILLVNVIELMLINTYAVYISCFICAFRTTGFFRTFNTIFRAIKDKYYNITCNELIKLFIWILFMKLFMSFIFIPICRAYISYNILVKVFIIILILVFPFLFFIYLFIVERLITFWEKYDEEIILYNIVHTRFIPFTIGLFYILLAYFISGLIQWDILFADGLILMWGQGGSTGGSSMGGSSMGGGGNPGPQGQPPQGPWSHIVGIAHADPHVSEDGKVQINTTNTQDFPIYRLIQLYKLNNPTCLVPTDSDILFNPEIHQRTIIGKYYNPRARCYENYFMHTYHETPVKVYDDKIESSIIMGSYPLPQGFYYYSNKKRAFTPIYFSKHNLFINRDLYVKTTDDQYVLFPFSIPYTIRTVKF